MHWELWDRQSAHLIEEFDSEEEALQSVRDMLTANGPELVDALSVGAMYDEGESHDAEPPPSLYGEKLRARLEEMAQQVETEAAHEVHERIRKWLAEEGWHVRDVGDPQSSFNIMATLQSGPNVNIFQYRDHFDHITLSQHCVFDESSRIEIARLPITVQRKTVHHVYRDVAIMGAEITDLGVPSTEMRIRTRVYFDGLTKDAFIQRILLTIRALRVSLQTFVEALEESAYQVEAEEAEPPAEQAANGEAGYSVEVEVADAPDEFPSNVVRLRPPTKVPANDGDSRTVAS